jgi:hypothetical protein
LGRVFIAGVVAIGLLVGGSLMAVVLLTEGRGREGGGGLAGSSGAAEGSETFERAPVQAAPPPALTAPTPIPGSAPVIYEAAPPPPPPDSWQAVPIAAKAKALGPVGGGIARALRDMQDDFRACFTADTAARKGSEAVSTTNDAFQPDETGGTALVLQLEMQRDAVRVVDAPMETRGGASEETISCAQSLLRGRVLKVPGSKAGGGRQRLRFMLSP